MINKNLTTLIETAKVLGLNENDLNHAKELLVNREYGLAFDTIVTQLFEYEIEIDEDFYLSLELIAQKMKISGSEYSFMQELIRSGNSIPKPVKNKISELLQNLISEKDKDL